MLPPVRAQRGAGAQSPRKVSTQPRALLMPADFVGSSGEVQHPTDPSFFSEGNVGLIRQFKALAPGGVLRLGGNTSEFAWWKATPGSSEPEHPQTLAWSKASPNDSITP